MKTTRRPGVIDAASNSTVRLNVRIDADARKRLAIHCAMTGLEPGEVLNRLIHSLRDWSMPVNLAARAVSRDRQSQADPVIPDAPIPAISDAA